MDSSSSTLGPPRPLHHTTNNDNDGVTATTTAQEECILMAQTEASVLASRGTTHRTTTAPLAVVQYVRNAAAHHTHNHHCPMLDGQGRPVSVDRILATNPLRSDLSTRPGPGNRKLTYMTGDSVNRALNEIFGYDGWSSDIKQVTQTEKEQDKNGRWHIAYLTHVRITLTATGTYKEDMGSGDSIDKNLQNAVSHAVKASITDAIKRAARQFGDKLGNSLYGADFAIRKAPTNVFQALEDYDHEMRTKWGTSNVPVVAAASNNNNDTQQQQGVTRPTTTGTMTMATRPMPPPPVVTSHRHPHPNPPSSTAESPAVITPRESSLSSSSVRGSSMNNTYMLNHNSSHGPQQQQQERTNSHHHGVGYQGSHNHANTTTTGQTVTPYHQQPSTYHQRPARSAPEVPQQFRPLEPNSVEQQHRMIRPPPTSAESLRASFGNNGQPQPHAYNVSRSQPSSYTKRSSGDPMPSSDMGKRPRIHSNPYAPS